jgi:hypothetical protein
MAEDTEDKVGFGHPPRQSRFQKGRSGNPAGRPVGSRNLRTDLVAELSSESWVEGEGLVSRQRLILRRLANKALDGDVRASMAILALAERLLPAEEERPAEGDERLYEALIEGQAVRLDDKPAPPTEGLADE